MILLHLVAAPPTAKYATGSLLRLGEDVLVLGVAESEGAVSVFVTDYEWKAREARHERYKRGRSVVILARRHGGLPLAEIETSLGACANDGDLAERGVRVAGRELVGSRPAGRNCQTAPLLNHRRFQVLGCDRGWTPAGFRRC